MPRLRGEHHPNAKLSEQDVIEILHDYEPGLVSMRVLAERHGCTVYQVQKIISGEAWAHVPRPRDMHA